MVGVLGSCAYVGGMSKPKREVVPVEGYVRHAAELRQRVDAVQDRVRDREVSSEVLGGRVRVVVTCSGQVRGITVDPGLLAEEGLDMVMDLVVTALNKAMGEADKVVDAEVLGATGGLRIPGISA